MLYTLLLWLCDVVVPKTPQLSPVTHPLTDLEWLLLSTLQFDVRSTQELTHDDYGLEMSLHTTDFEDLFQRMEVAVSYFRSDSNLNELEVLYDRRQVSLVSYRLGCKREYNDLPTLMEITMGKVQTFLVRLNDLPTDVKRLQLRYCNYLLSDIAELLDCLHKRNTYLNEE